jgi:hypothetical protein
MVLAAGDPPLWAQIAPRLAVLCGAIALLAFKPHNCDVCLPRVRSWRGSATQGRPKATTGFALGPRVKKGRIVFEGIGKSENDLT